MSVGYQLIAGDHDFHVVNLTPSVTLLTDIKPNEIAMEDYLASIKVRCAPCYFIPYKILKSFFASMCSRMECSCVLEGLYL